MALLASCGSPTSEIAAVPTTAEPATTTVQIRVPDVVGESAEFAAGLLSTLGLEAVVTAVEGLRGEPGVVVKQLPLPGTAVTKRSVVVLQTPPPIPATTAAPAAPAATTAAPTAAPAATTAATTAAPAATTAAPAATTATTAVPTTTVAPTTTTLSPEKRCEISLNNGPADCPGAQLVGIRLRDKQLKGSDFSNANLSGANLGDSYFLGSDFSNANLENTHLYRTDMRDVDLSGANLSGAQVLKTFFDEANLSGANLTGITGATAYMMGDAASWDGADMSGVNLSGVDLSGADFSEVRSLEGAILRDISGYGLRFSSGDNEPPSLVGADLSGAYLYLAKMRYLDMRGATLVDADLTHTDLYGSDLRDADFSGARFDNTNLQSGDFRNANFSGATGNWSMESGDFAGANFSGAYIGSIGDPSAVWSGIICDSDTKSTGPWLPSVC